jgi:hypothetical protein
VLAPSGERLAKRNRPASIRQLRAQGLQPGAIISALAVSGGLPPLASPAELVAHFDLGRLSREAVVIDPAVH